MLWRLDCDVPDRLSRQVRPRSGVHVFRVRVRTAPEFKVLRDYVAWLTRSGVSCEVLALELATTPRTVKRWALVAGTQEEGLRHGDE